MRLVRLIVRLEERKVVGKEDSEEFFHTVWSHLASLNTYHLCSWGPCVGIRRAMALIGDAKQDMSDRKVETRLTGLAAMAQYAV